MATFVHNEPTCLGVIQENGLPEAFYRVVEHGLEPAIEVCHTIIFLSFPSHRVYQVIQAIPNAIGALCLNQAGQDQLAARPNIIPCLFSIFTSERHQRILQEKENAVLIGTAIEELIRHHPALKERVVDGIKMTLAKIEELGKAYEPSEDLKPYYQLSPVQTPVGPATGEQGDVDMDRGASSQSPTSVTLVRPPEVDGEVGVEPTDDLSPKSHDNSIVSYMDVLCKVRYLYAPRPSHSSSL